ncbi:hypothetical protein OG455_08530 [Kitasatospora sp. NBC_01287]|uniref:WXG100-like domain-containing protein n=1 Tax=Kitasatospora sp. NBC_01287 TaxID=2903573 RepID=UPI0022568168|nr:hypothetical protein [Kitasatospora sp. NBC_01287]MCX4745568.1 hypothetical protein [Kitasatospora sp. NBC_01287]
MGESTAEKLVRETTGMWWPAADSGGLRKAAGDWTAMATALDNVAAAANTAAQGVISNNHGAGIDAFATFWGRYYSSGKGWLPDTANACRQMAKALNAFADEVDKAVHKLEEQAAIVGASLIAGTALAFFTAGLSEAAAGAATAGIIAMADGLGVAVSETIASIAATTLTGAVFGTVESVAVDAAVAQPIRIAFGDGGFSGTELLSAAETGAFTGAAAGGFGAGARALSTAANSAEGASAALAAIGRFSAGVDTLPGRMLTGAALSAGSDEVFGGNVSLLDVATGAIGAAAAPGGRGRVRDPEDGVGPVGEGDGDGEGGWGGAGWVDEPSDFAGKAYEAIRATPNKDDLPKISANTGVDESVLRQVKAHLFRSQHEVAVGPGEVRTGLFTPRDDIARLWQGATDGTLTKADASEFKALMTHEYVESELMKAGLPYVSDDPAVWDPEDNSKLFPKDVRQAGAHDLSPHPVEGHWRGWRSMGLTPPDIPLNDDLSNLGILTKSVKQALRQEGLELK